MAASLSVPVQLFGKNLVRVHSTRKFPTLWNHRETWIRNEAAPSPRLTHLLPRPLRPPLVSLGCRRLPILHLWSGSCSSPSQSSLSSMAFSTQAASDPPQPSPTKTVRVVIKGRVQGVFYRNWTVENAKELGLKGWVRNRRDGSVEALFSGNPDSVQEMEQRCRRGPPASMVTSLQVFPSSDDPGTGFELKQTA